LRGISRRIHIGLVAAAILSVSGCGAGSSGTSGHVYWVNGADGTITKTPIGGGTAITLARGQASAIALAVDRTHVYWIDLASRKSAGTVDEIPIQGGTVKTLATSKTFGDSYYLNSPDSIAVDAKSVYWTDMTAGTVNEVPRFGGRVTILASHQTDPESLAVEGGHVYWVNNGYGKQGTVNSVPVGGGKVTTLVSTSEPWAVAVDARDLYWTDWGGTVNKMPLHGGKVTILARGSSTTANRH
jgi:sugar lactone lactonase YvrE